MTTELVAWLGVCIALAAGLAAIGSWVEAKLANARAKAANELMLEANRLAEEANTAAAKSITMAEEANRISAEANTAATEALELQKSADERTAVILKVLRQSNGPITLRNDGHADVFVTEIDFTSGPTTVLETLWQTVPGFGSLPLYPSKANCAVGDEAKIQWAHAAAWDQDGYSQLQTSLARIERA